MNNIRSTGSLRLHPAAARIPEQTPSEYRALVSDIRARGIAEPLAITTDGRILDGRHRWHAATKLGVPEVPVRLVEVDDELDYMFSAAIERRHLSAGQRALLVLERDDYRQAREDALARKTQGTNELRATLPEAKRPREVAARLAGVSPRTAQDAITVREADPELVERVRTGDMSVSHAAAQLRRQRRLEELAAPLLPEGPFAVIYADPPWRYGNPRSNRAAEIHYPTMPIDEIRAVPVPVADNAVCFLWAVNGLLPDALDVLAAWGFSYRTNLVWVKDKLGLGFYVRGQHELLLVGTRGSMPLPAEPDRPASVIIAARKAHSVKPEAAYELIERMYPGLPRVELFARQERQGWVAWGNELPGLTGEEREVS